MKDYASRELRIAGVDAKASNDVAAGLKGLFTALMFVGGVLGMVALCVVLHDMM